MDPSLRTAALRLTSPLRAERDAGEAALIAARQDAIPALAFVLGHVVATPVGGIDHSPVARAALILGALKARDAVPALCKVVRAGRLSGDDGAFVARAFAEILDGRDAFDDDVRATLEALAGSPDMFTRAYAAEAFGALGDQRSKGRVQALVVDKDQWVRDRAQAVLVRLADVTAKSAADGVSLADFAALVDDASRQGGDLKPWLDDLRDERRAVRDAAINELIKAGKVAVPFLLDQVNQPNVRARIGAATALGRLQPPEACGPLLIAATAPASTADERELRPIALRALANCLTGVEEGLAASIFPLAQDADRFTRAAALLCLGRLADRRGMRVVVQAIVEDDPFVVESAAVALSEGVREDDLDLVRPLLVALAKRPAPKPAVKEAILIALSRIAIDDVALRVRARHRVRRDVFGPSASTRKAAIVLLERMYSDEDPPPLSVVDDVLSRVQDDHPEVRVVAASFVSRHLQPGFSGAPGRLSAGLLRHERTVSLLCLEALRRHDSDAARAVIDAATRNSDAVVATRARELLADFKPNVSEWRFSSAPPSTTPMPVTTPTTTAAPITTTTATTSIPTTVSTLPRPAISDSQRPHRVRRAGDGGDVVEAKDGPLPASPGAPKAPPP